MKVYVLSLGAGLLVGLIYHLLDVRSPAPPLVALVGLLGILVGEQIVPVTKLLIRGSSFSQAFHLSSCDSHIFGMLPGHRTDRAVEDQRKIEKQT